ncbi:hypothetical protein CDG76_17855 [Nostoc sp. 'Peltigera membranacea cyanobiont' 210A]|nr:hypothetical protein CDG76_17855 [Nostoc sp. 'Peltigera membranacea cyanobiont' 210A]
MTSASSVVRFPFPLRKSYKKWMAELARKGGSSTSAAKSEASRLNGTDRPRKEILLATDEA